MVVAKSKESPVIVYSVWHRASKFSRNEAAAWCKEHDFTIENYWPRKDNETDELTHHVHIQIPGDQAVEGSFRVMSDDFPDGITVTVAQIEAQEAA